MTGAVGSVTGLTASNLDATVSSRATPTNITGGTITTVTNLTNAPTSGDLTATMKTSVTAAVPTAAANAAAVLAAMLTDNSGFSVVNALDALVNELGGNWTQSGNTFTLFKADGTTIRLQATIPADGSARTVTTFNN